MEPLHLNDAVGPCMTSGVSQKKEKKMLLLRTVDEGVEDRHSGEQTGDERQWGWTRAT